MVSTTEVAKHAGVSQTTVSRVLNRPEQVKKETYDKVMQALAELDYGNAVQPETQEVSENRNVLAMLGKECPAETIDTLRELTEQAQAFGYQLVARTLTSSETAEDIKAYVNEVAGVVAIGTVPGEILEQVKAAGQAFLVVEEMNTTNEKFDGKQAAGLAVSHLVQQNHQQIAWVGMDSEDSGERLQGYYGALAQHQVKLRKKRIHTPRDAADFDVIASELRSFKKPTSAFVAASYEDGIKLVEALKSARFKVPKEISVIALGAPKEGEPALELTAVKPIGTNPTAAQQVMQQLTQQLGGVSSQMEESAEELQIDNKNTVKAFKNKKNK